MNKLLLLLVFVLVSLGVWAQDVIVLKDGTEVQCVVESISPSTVTYKKSSSANAPTYTLPLDLLDHITYDKGKTIRFADNIGDASEPTNNSYITQETASQYSNDQQLRNLYYMSKDKNLAKAKTYKIVGYTVGPLFVIGGAVLMGIGISWGIEPGNDGGTLFYPGLLAAGLGIGTTAYCISQSNKYKKRSRELNVASLWSHNFSFESGSNLSIGVDAIGMQNSFDKTIGLGVRYTF